MYLTKTRHSTVECSVTRTKLLCHLTPSNKNNFVDNLTPNSHQIGHFYLLCRSTKFSHPFFSLTALSQILRGMVWCKIIHSVLPKNRHHFRKTSGFKMEVTKKYLSQKMFLLAIKPCGFCSRIRDMEAKSYNWSHFLVNH